MFAPCKSRSKLQPCNLMHVLFCVHVSISHSDHVPAFLMTVCSTHVCALRYCMQYPCVCNELIKAGAGDKAEDVLEWRDFLDMDD